jgi:hypothetical protein
MLAAGSHDLMSYMIERRSARAVYLYTYTRERGRVRRRYIGSGAWAVREARRLDDERRERLALNEQVDAANRARREQADAIDREVAGYSEGVDCLFVGAMVAAGCHRHKHTWRKRRMSTQEKGEAAGRLRQIGDAIASGDPVARRVIASAFDAAPENVEA